MRNGAQVLVMLCLLWIGGVASAQSAPTARPLTAVRIFDEQRVVKVEIQLAKADWGALRHQSRRIAESLGRKPAKRPFRYFKGDVTIDGVRIENVGIRKKGFIGSLARERPSLKIRFDKFGTKAPIRGFDRLTLNNNKQERSGLSAYLFYKMHRDAGLAAPRCNYAVVFVNGKSLGIYSNVESIRRPMLDRCFGSSKGELFEGTVADFFLGAEEKFELKNKKANLDAIRQVAAAFDQDEVDLKKVEQHLDLDAFVKFWALESLCGFWDGYCQNQNNFFVYRAPQNAKLYFIPWGADAAFQTMMLPQYSVRAKTVHHQAMLPNRLYRIPQVRDRYHKTLQNLMKDLWVEERLLAETAKVKERLEKHALRQRAFTKAVKRVERWIKKRRRILEREIEEWPVELNDGPREPIYFEVIGEAKATFTTTYSRKQPKEMLDTGKKQLELKMDGKLVEFKRLGVTSSLSTMPTLDGSPKPPTIVFTGKRASDNKQFVLAVAPSREDFVPGNGKAIKVEGLVLEGTFGFLNRKGFKLVAGSATLEAAAMEEKAPVRGSLEVKVYRQVGGEPVKYPRKPKSEKKR